MARDREIYAGVEPVGRVVGVRREARRLAEHEPGLLGQTHERPVGEDVDRRCGVKDIDHGREPAVRPLGGGEAGRQGVDAWMERIGRRQAGQQGKRGDRGAVRPAGDPAGLLPGREGDHDVGHRGERRDRIVRHGDDETAATMTLGRITHLAGAPGRRDRDQDEVVGRCRCDGRGRDVDPGVGAGRPQARGDDRGRVPGTAEAREREPRSTAEVGPAPPVEQSGERRGRGLDIGFEEVDAIRRVGHASDLDPGSGSDVANRPRIPSVGAHSHDGRYVAA